MIVAATFVGCEIGVGTDAEGDSQSEPERTSPGDESHSARPSNIPIPDSPNYSFPDVTNEIEVSRIPQEDLANFEPMLTEEPAIDPISSIPWGYAFSPQRVVLIEDGVIRDLVGVVYKKFGTPYTMHVALFENPLLSNPVALSQRVCYRKIFSHQISYPSTYSETHTVTAGTETTQAATFEKTSGWETTATVGATNGFVSAEVTASYSEEVTQTFGETISLSTYETKEQTFSSTPDEGEDLLLAAWNKELLFEYVGANGDPWGAAQFSFEAPIRFSNQTGKDLVTTNDRFYRE